MNKKQREVLIRSYNSFDVNIDSDDYAGIGKVIILRRKMAEFLGLDLSQNVLPGEYCDDEDGYENRFYEKRELNDDDLTEKEKSYLSSLLKIASTISGSNDIDDACLRCACRMLAEVVDYEPLSHYFLLGENDSTKRKYIK